MRVVGALVLLVLIYLFIFLYFIFLDCSGEQKG